MSRDQVDQIAKSKFITLYGSCAAKSDHCLTADKPTADEVTKHSKRIGIPSNRLTLLMP